jgi:hypothetical protein
VEDKTLATRKEQTKRRSFAAENPPLATVNTHLAPKPEFICNKPGRSDITVRPWEVVDERRRVVQLRSRDRVARRRKDQKAHRGMIKSRLKGYQSDSYLRGQEASGFRQEGHLQSGNL